jgi:hypothetical protein
MSHKTQLPRKIDLITYKFFAVLQKSNKTHLCIEEWPGTLCRMALVRTDVSEGLSFYIIKVTRIGELGTLVVTSSRRTLRTNTKKDFVCIYIYIYTEKYFVFLRCVRRLPVTAIIPSSPILVTLMMKALCSSVTSVLTRATLRSIPEVAIRHSCPCENLKSYALTYY